MGCPSAVEIGDNLVFSIVSHDPDTGVVSDASSAPPYRVYEDMGTTKILSGTMTLMVDDDDAANTTGFYRALIACTAANGFEAGKTYTIYIEATVDGDKGGITFAFKAVAKVAGVSHAEALRRIGAITSGIVTNAGTGNETFKDYAASANTIVIVCDGSGNRSSITYN